jgi:FKBP-type peptidyl-prolyl cis-trans isomerase FkpA
MFKKIICTIVILSAFAGCLKNKDNTFTCNYDPCAVKAPAAETDSLKKYLAANNITTAVQHCSGLYYEILNAGTGRTPSPCKRIAVRYKGALTNGNVFDEQTAPQTFNLSSLIRGWTNAIPLIKEGGSIKLYIPPSLGYGSQDIRNQAGAVVVPANSILVFTIQLDAAEE